MVDREPGISGVIEPFAGFNESGNAVVSQEEPKLRNERREIDYVGDRCLSNRVGEMRPRMR